MSISTSLPQPRKENLTKNILRSDKDAPVLHPHHPWSFRKVSLHQKYPETSPNPSLSGKPRSPYPSQKRRPPECRQPAFRESRRTSSEKQHASPPRSWAKHIPARF